MKYDLKFLSKLLYIMMIKLISKERISNLKLFAFKESLCF